MLGTASPHQSALPSPLAPLSARSPGGRELSAQLTERFPLGSALPPQRAPSPMPAVNRMGTSINSAFRIPHSSVAEYQFRIPHSEFRIPHSAFFYRATNYTPSRRSCPALVEEPPLQICTNHNSSPGIGLTDGKNAFTIRNDRQCGAALPGWYPAVFDTFPCDLDPATVREAFVLPGTSIFRRGMDIYCPAAASAA